ncbi:hypothetical protein KJA15_03455 [Patescibacteria group bacterium]|nr:hypothetical protein [Patescibacteria group bacterium]
MKQKVQVVQREIFLVWYSSEQYPTPEDFKERLDEKLSKFVVRSGLNPRRFTVAIKTKDVVGHFLASAGFPGLGLIAGAKNFIIKFVSRE